MLELDPNRFNDAFQLTRTSRDWLRIGLVLARRGGANLLQLKVNARVLLSRNEREELWVGSVVQRTPTGVLLECWGSERLLAVPFDELLGAGIVGPHTHREHTQVCGRQRTGEPARAYKAEPLVELSDQMHRRLKKYAGARGLTLEQGFEKLIGTALRRLAALGIRAAEQEPSC